MPQTFMNLSGTSVLSHLTADGFTPADVLVAFDDADLPLGSLRFRRGGGSGGHRGIASILASIGPDFARLKIGIGRPGRRAEEGLVTHVLGRFDADEEALINAALNKAVAALEDYLEKGLDKTMEIWNRKTEDSKPEL